MREASSTPSNPNLGSAKGKLGWTVYIIWDFVNLLLVFRWDDGLAGEILVGVGCVGMSV